MIIEIVANIVISCLRWFRTITTRLSMLSQLWLRRVSTIRRRISSLMIWPMRALLRHLASSRWMHSFCSRWESQIWKETASLRAQIESSSTIKSSISYPVTTASPIMILTTVLTHPMIQLASVNRSRPSPSWVTRHLSCKVSLVTQRWTSIRTLILIDLTNISHRLLIHISNKLLNIFN